MFTRNFISKGKAMTPQEMRDQYEKETPNWGRPFMPYSKWLESRLSESQQECEIYKGSYDLANSTVSRLTAEVESLNQKITAYETTLLGTIVDAIEKASTGNKGVV